MNTAEAITHYNRLKKAHSDCLFLFEVGDFYESYSTDAEVVSAITGTTLTIMNGKKRKDGAMAIIPYHSLTDNLKKLVGAGCRVAVCETPKK